MRQGRWGKQEKKTENSLKENRIHGCKQKGQPNVWVTQWECQN